MSTSAIRVRCVTWTGRIGDTQTAPIVRIWYAVQWDAMNFPFDTIAVKRPETNHSNGSSRFVCVYVYVQCPLLCGCGKNFINSKGLYKEKDENFVRESSTRGTLDLCSMFIWANTLYRLSNCIQDISSSKVWVAMHLCKGERPRVWPLRTGRWLPKNMCYNFSVFPSKKRPSTNLGMHKGSRTMFSGSTFATYVREIKATKLLFIRPVFMNK